MPSNFQEFFIKKRRIFRVTFFMLADIVLVEGFKHEAIPKIEVYRAELNRPLLAIEDANIIAVASDTTLSIHQPQINLNDIDAMVGFIHQWLKLSSPG